jgi:AcrR family transcriptional regulator
MQRARSEEEKRERRDSILETALAMYEREPSYSGFTMAALAKEAGLAKGTLYLYFTHKEEVFLALVGTLFEEWFDDVDGRLERGRGEWNAERAAEAVLASVRGRVTLVRLLSILPAIVEQNVEMDAALAFKRRELERCLETGGRLEGRLKFLRPGQGGRLMMHLHAMVIGVWQLAEPSPVVRRVMEQPGMEPARLDFERDLHTLLLALLRGMEIDGAAA